MRLQSLSLISAIALLTVACAPSSTVSTPNEPVEAPTVTDTPATASVSESPPAAPVPPTPMASNEQGIFASGEFTAAAHSTQGEVVLMQENGDRVLQLGDGFQTDRGPDLFVLLHRSSSPESYEPDQYVNLGALQSQSGRQRYVIPAEVNLDDYATVVIWCRQFNVTFGYAPLQSS